MCSVSDACLLPCWQVVDAGAVVLLVLCVQEPELSLKRVAASALSDIAKHTPELAQAVVDAGLSAYINPLLCVITVYQHRSAWKAKTVNPRT